LVAGALAATALVVTTVGEGVVEARSKAKPLLTELSSPKGIDVAPDGAIIVAQGAFGDPGPVLRYDLTLPKRRRVTEVTDPFSIVDVAIDPRGGSGWAIGSDLVLYQRFDDDGRIVPVLDIAAYQEGDPDPVDRDRPPNPIESNPYGLTVMPNGDALVADAAGNDIIRVKSNGDATTVARLDIESISTDHLGDPSLPPALEAEAVPTSVTIGPDGAIYVGELKGFPFRPGTSHVWRIEADAENAWCSVNEPSVDCEVYKEGLTAIQDIDFNLKNGRLYVYELAADGVLAFEEGFETGDFPDAVLLQLSPAGAKKERRRELAAGQLSEPGGVAVKPNGRVFVTDGVFTGGRMLRISR
jgi:streptogramin lyase